MKGKNQNSVNLAMGSLSLLLGGLGVCLTLFLFFGVLESLQDASPGQPTLLLPIGLSLLIFITSLVTYVYIRIKCKYLSV